MKKTTRKSKSPKRTNLDSLRPEKNPRVRREFIDYDYIQDLKKQDPESLEWLAKFNSEFYGAAISKNEDTGRAVKGQLHKKQAQMKDIFDDNNRRNNDVLGVSRVNIGLTQLSSELDAKDGWHITDINLTEAAVVSEIDRKREEEDYLTYEEYQELKGNLSLEMLMIYESIYGDREEN